MREMARSRWILGGLLLLCVLALAQCAMLREWTTGEEWHTPRVVQVKGVELCSSLSPPLPTKARAGRPVGILARDGDLIACGNSGFIYRETDGESLVLGEEGEVRLLNGKPVSIQLKDQGTGWEWLRKASTEDLAGLRLLDVEKQADTLDFLLLEKVARVRPDIGLFLGIDQADVAVRVVSLFEPHFLVINLDVLSARFDALEPRLAKLEVLWTLGEGSLDFLPRLPRLHTLMLMNWVPAGSGGIPGGSRTLRSLTLADGKGVEDLSFLRNVTGLQELSLLGFEELKDITALATFPGLKKVALLGCKNVRDLSVLDQLPNLVWVGFPRNTTQEVFAKVIASHPGLEVVELLGSDDIRDLSPLRSLRHLRAAILLHMKVDIGVLQDLKGLRYLALGKEAFEGDAAEKFTTLEQALPDTFVAQEAPLCLGSGWILLLVPATVLLRWLWSCGHGSRSATHA